MTDPLLTLSACRQNLAAIKARDFAAETGASMPEQTVMVPSLATGRCEVPMLSAADFNASRRAFERRHAFTPYYDRAKSRAMRPVLGQLRMIEAAIRCDVACREAVAAMRRAVQS